MTDNNKDFFYGEFNIAKIQSLTGLTSVLTALPRGGYLVDSSAGYIQFGAPPETLKDTKLLPQGVPQIFILPHDHFHPSQGISMAEVEFPIYFNFFILKRRCKIYVEPGFVTNMQTVLNEAAFGPKKIDINKEVEIQEGSCIPDIKAEMDYFRGDNSLEKMIDLLPITEEGIEIGEVKVIPQIGVGWKVYDKGELIAEVPEHMEFKGHLDLGTTLQEPFETPEFGITCLGPSHGFDHEQNTSGFLFWINKTGIMVDPPVNSTQWLSESNVNPKLIDTLILTHCHADHDSGTFQKILEEGKVKVYTTPTVMQSFLRKYSALTRMPISTLMTLFEFIPVKMNQSYNIHGAIFNFYYSLHSIPTVAFHFSYRNKSFVYSSDHLNEPTIINQMFEKGVISQARRDHLLNFPWDADIIYHEAGVPPLHTPISYLNSLPEEIQKKITVYHIAAKDFPQDTHLTLARFGIGETLYPSVEKHVHEEAYRVLDVFSRIDIFNELPREKFKDLLLIVKKEEFNRGDYIIRKDSVGDKFYVIVMGNVSIGGLENVEDKVYGTYEYFGEASIIQNTPRSADVIAATHVVSYSIEAGAFLRLIRHTPVETYIKQVAEMRNGESWNVIKSNRYFSKLSSSQITQLESIVHDFSLSPGDFLFHQGDPNDNVYLVIEGVLCDCKGNETGIEYSRGDLIASRFSENGSNHQRKTDCVAKEYARLYRISTHDFDNFLTENPGIKLEMMYDERNDQTAL